MKKPNLSRTLHRGLAMILAFGAAPWYAACGGAGGACQLRRRAGLLPAWRMGRSSVCWICLDQENGLQKAELMETCLRPR